MYVGNVVLLILNLPLVGLFVNLLRIPYSYLYPAILCFCILGVYSVSNSVVDVWIMLGMGLFGYVLRKTGFEPAPIALGLILSPMFELSLRQSLAMSGGSYGIFFDRPIAIGMFVVAIVLVLLGLKPLFFKSSDWRERVGLEE
jgi:putative tricarboxylic transport membrane protein